MKLNKFNENSSIDKLKENIEFTLLSLKDDGYFIEVKDRDNLVVTIRIPSKTGLVQVPVEPIYEYIEEIYDYAKNIGAKFVKIELTLVSYSGTVVVKHLDKSTGKLTDSPIDNGNWYDIKDSIDFCIFSNDGEMDEFYQIKLYIE